MNICHINKFRIDAKKKKIYENIHISRFIVYGIGHSVFCFIDYILLLM